MELITLSNVLGAVSTINKFCKSINHNCLVCPLAYPSQSGHFNCSVNHKNWKLEEHTRSKELKRNVPSTWSDGHRLHMWTVPVGPLGRLREDNSNGPSEDDSDDPLGERFWNVIKKLVPYFMAFLLGRIFAIIGLAPIFVEEGMISQHIMLLIGVLSVTAFIAGYIVGSPSSKYASNVGKIEAIAVSGIAYLMMTLAWFDPAGFIVPGVAQPFIAIFSMIIAFSVGVLVADLSGDLDDHIIRIFIFCASIFLAVYNLGYSLTVSGYDIKNTYMIQFFNFLSLFIIMLAKREGYRYGE